MDKNIILHGPPGTGKTYHTVLYAVAIIENKPLDVVIQELKTDGFDGIKARYEEYKEEGQIALTTFHPSYGYEEFIEGIKPRLLSEEQSTPSNGEVGYEIVPGVFKRFCDKAGQPVIEASNDYGIRQNPTIWKVSLGGSKDNPVKRDGFANNRIRIGWDMYGEHVDEETDYKTNGGEMIIKRFINEMRRGDIVLTLHDEETIDAIGVVTGEYAWLSQMEEYKRSRPVRWLVKDIRENIYELNGNKVMTLGSVYRLNRITLADVQGMLQRHHAGQAEKAIHRNDRNYVFIIDEINRGNISKLFGELITLIEPSKRLGMQEARELTLPYSQEPFGVPANVYLLGTMNTADRSISRLDTALRRRFAFSEVMPDPNCLGAVEINGEQLNLSAMLAAMNERIEVLYDREHTIGHAYLIPVLKERSLEKLGHVFEHAIIPLLQEYFYDDDSKVRLVLGDNRKPAAEQFVVEEKVNAGALFGDLEEEDLGEFVRYRINRSAFARLSAYVQIYSR